MSVSSTVTTADAATAFTEALAIRRELA